MAMVSYNALEIVFAALFATKDEKDVLNLSLFSVADQISTTTRGMLIATSETYWQQMTTCATQEFAEELKAIARTVNMKKYRKAKCGPKKKPPKRSRSSVTKHVSTARLLELTKTR